MEVLDFKQFNLSSEVQKAIEEMGFEEATPIQAMTIPKMMQGLDLIGQAQTGTGKTCAFGIPAVEMLPKNSSGIQVLVLSPTRELAIQIAEELKSVCRYRGDIGILPIYGGQPIERQITALRKKPQIIIGTPGRVMDHMRRNTLKLHDIKLVVLDEADEMLNMGFREDIDTILEDVPKERQTVLFSATMPKEIINLTKLYQKDPVMMKATHKELTVPAIEQYYLEVSDANRLEVLTRIIDTNNYKLSLVFCNTKRRVDQLTINIQSRGYAAEALHGDMKQSERDRVMNKFRKGTIDILVATDVAARGIDVDDIEAVFNYDVPNDEEYYVHRIGRTGRAGKTGKAYSFVWGRELYELRDIQKYIKTNIVQIKPPTVIDVEEKKFSSVISTLSQSIKSDNLSKYVSYVERIVNEVNQLDHTDENIYTTLDVAAAFLKILSAQGGALSGFQIYSREDIENDGVDTETKAVEKKSKKRTKEDEGYGFGDKYRKEKKSKNKDYGSRDEIHYERTDNFDHAEQRLFVNVGRDDKVKVKSIVDSICQHTNLPKKVVGDIDIYDRFFFVNVPDKYATDIAKAIKKYGIIGVKGRNINVEKAK